MNFLKRAIGILRKSISVCYGMDLKIDEIKINQGIILTELHARKDSKNLRDYEFKVFSQWGEDGIIQRLVSVLDIQDKTFIEFGVEDFSESNCRFLMMKDHWRGFVIDGSPDRIHSLKNSYYFWKYDLQAVASFITRENINDLLVRSGFGEDLGILSIDLDGIDYYVLKAIETYRPRIIICEYNALFGATRKISVPYDPAFARTEKHYSNLYAGASLAAIAHAAAQKGYSLVGTNTASNNAFFVRNDVLNDKLKALRAEEAYTPASFRDSRGRDGNLSYLSADAGRELIKGLPVFNVETESIETL